MYDTTIIKFIAKQNLIVIYEHGKTKKFDYQIKKNLLKLLLKCYVQRYFIFDKLKIENIFH